jgi:hypothetical protein
MGTTAALGHVTDIRHHMVMHLGIDLIRVFSVSSRRYSAS